jgi:hypothetical protein
VVEIISPGSEGVDTVTKRSEYAAAGIPRYWMVDQDPAQTVTMHHLDGDHYAVRASMPLAWVLNTVPAEHDPRLISANRSGGDMGLAANRPRSDLARYGPPLAGK